MNTHGHTKTCRQMFRTAFLSDSHTLETTQMSIKSQMDKQSGISIQWKTTQQSYGINYWCKKPHKGNIVGWMVPPPHTHTHTERYAHVLGPETVDVTWFGKRVLIDVIKILEMLSSQLLGWNFNPITNVLIQDRRRHRNIEEKVMWKQRHRMMSCSQKPRKA